MHEQLDVNPSGMKGIYVTDGIKIDVYSENAFDEVAKSFCVYMVAVERLEGANTVDSRTFKGNRKKFELSGARRKQPEVRKKKQFFLHSEHFNHPFNCRKVKETIERSEKIFLDYKSERDVTKHCLN